MTSSGGAEGSRYERFTAILDERQSLDADQASTRERATALGVQPGSTPCSSTASISQSVDYCSGLANGHGGVESLLRSKALSVIMPDQNSRVMIHAPRGGNC